MAVQNYNMKLDYFIEFDGKKLVPEDLDKLGMMIHTPNNIYGFSFNYEQFVMFIDNVFRDKEHFESKFGNIF